MLLSSEHAAVSLLVCVNTRLLSLLQFKLVEPACYLSQAAEVLTEAAATTMGMRKRSNLWALSANLDQCRF